MENKTRYAVGNLSINLDGGGQKHPDIISPAMPESGQGPVPTPIVFKDLQLPQALPAAAAKLKFQPLHCSF